MRKGMGSHQSAAIKKDEWLTPPEIIKPLGFFDLDPCSPISRPWDTANHHFTVDDDGLEKKWFGRVWLNPPYGSETGKWLKLLSEHGDGTALIFARTETEMFFEQVWAKATALLFIKGRLFFHHLNGNKSKHNAGAPSVLIAYSVWDARCLKESGIEGQFIPLATYL